jgi:hypothetical protein
MQKIFFFLVSFITLLSIQACGNNGGSGWISSGVTVANDVTITGQVAGTSFVAVDAASSTVVARQVAEIQSDGTKTFSIKVLSGKQYKFYLVENEGTSDERLFPLYIGNGNKIKVAAGTCDLGFVTTSSDGKAIPAIIPTQFTDAVEETTIPTAVLKNQSSLFTQADLTGTWYVFQFVSGANPGWLKATYEVSATGWGEPKNGLGNQISSVAIRNELDLIIHGNGFFQIALPDGTIGYSRSATFKRDSNGQIVDAAGNPLSPSITIPGNPNNPANLSVTSDGTVSVLISGQTEATTIGSIQLALFNNPAGLVSQSKNIFLPTDSSGIALTGTPGLGGLGTISLNPNGGVGQLTPMKLNISPGGVVINTASSSSTRLVMSRDKSFMVGVGGNAGDERISIAVKGGGTFQPADLAGNWKLHALTAGTAKHSWERGGVSISPAGTVTTSNILSAAGEAAFNIHSEPLILPANGDFSAMSVAMNLDKSVIVFVSSNQDGSSSLGLLVKMTDTGVSQNDLAGSWRDNLLTINSASDYWNRSLAVIDSAGNYKAFGVVGINGTESNSVNSTPFVVSPSGLISMVSDANLITRESVQHFEGILASNRKMLIYTASTGTDLAQYRLGILLK